MKELLAFGFSPRKNGNSDMLLDEFIRGAREAGAEANVFHTRKLKIHGCIECDKCQPTGECVLRDDMDRLYPLLVETKRVVVATPVFFFGVPSEAKAMVDRCQALWSRMRLFPDLKRPDGKGFFIAVGATKGKSVFTGTDLCIKYMYEAMGLPKTMEELTYRRVESKGAIKDHPDALREAFEAGRRFME